jgi:hypothetical protein
MTRAIKAAGKQVIKHVSLYIRQCLFSHPSMNGQKNVEQASNDAGLSEESNATYSAIRSQP